MTTTSNHHYKSTESKFKGGAQEMYVTYDVRRKTRGDNEALYPKVKRVYIAGEVKNWQVGDFKKRSGREAHGVKIDYEQSRAGYARKAFTANRGDTEYDVASAHVGKGASKFSKIVDVPDDAQNVVFHQDKLPEKYQHALQNVR